MSVLLAMVFNLVLLFRAGVVFTSAWLGGRKREKSKVKKKARIEVAINMAKSDPNSA